MTPSGTFSGTMNTFRNYAAGRKLQQKSTKMKMKVSAKNASNEMAMGQSRKIRLFPA